MAGCGGNRQLRHPLPTAEALMDEAEFLSRLIVPALIVGIAALALAAWRVLMRILGGGLVGLFILTSFVLFYILGPESARDWAHRTFGPLMETLVQLVSATASTALDILMRTGIG